MAPPERGQDHAEYVRALSPSRRRGRAQGVELDCLKEAATIETDVGRRFYGGHFGRRASCAQNSRAPIEDKRPMPKKPETNPKGEFALFNVVYEDNSVRSNCRVPNEILGGLRGDEPARGFIMEQDREIAQKGGCLAFSVKRIYGLAPRRSSRAPGSPPRFRAPR
jgi:hypothetical protein